MIEYTDRGLCQEKLNSHAIVLSHRIRYNKRKRSFTYAITEHIQ